MQLLVGTKTVHVDTGEELGKGHEVEVELPEDATVAHVEFIAPYVVVQYTRPAEA